jgi:aspartyl-tRNA(Asn)/glutamyl-tRNA(Gln) amidotransferase subunit B
MQWETVIGLEVHVQLATRSKIFSGASTQFGSHPNTQACAIDLGMPGVLPVLNEEAVRMAVKFGLATHCEIAPVSVFARKNYFYPDLPKGYQISQYELPIVHSGHLDIAVNGEIKRIGITRAHLEEDAGKSLHEDFHGMSGMDLNRAGTALLEIVSEPDMRTAEEAVAYLKTLHSLIRYLEISDGNLQKGNFRCDANVSVRPLGETKLGTRTEMKNINSFRYVEQAIHYEVARHIAIIEQGGKIVQQTRLFDSDKIETRPMRAKEEANDYRYFPDPDLLPVTLSTEFIEGIRKTLPELPEQKRDRFVSEFGLSEYDANLLTSSRELATYFETVQALLTPSNPKLAANWIMGDLLGALNKLSIDLASSPVSTNDMAILLNRIQDNTISGKIAKVVFEAMLQGEGNPDQIIEKQGLKQVTDASEIEKMIDDIIAANPEQVEQYRSGKDKVFGFFVGQAMKVSKGKANPAQVNDILKAKLKN